MAKLPEAKAEELAKKALEKQERYEAKAQEKEQTKTEKFAWEITPEERAEERQRKKAEEARKQKQIDKRHMGATVTNKSPVIQYKTLKNNNKPIDKMRYRVLDYTDKDDVALIKRMDSRYYIDNLSPTRVNGSVQYKIDYLNRQNELILKHFASSGTTPRYEKYICSCCGNPKRIDEFYRSYSYVQSGQMDESSQLYMGICKSCANKLFYFHYYHNCDKDLYQALERTCCDLNVYWDTGLAEEARVYHESLDGSVNVFAKYMMSLGKKTVYFGKTYWDSPTRVKLVVEVPPKDMEELTGSQDSQYADTLEDIIDTSNTTNQSNNSIMQAPIHWNAEEVKLRRKIITTLRYDPFGMYPEEDARKMYFDLDLMIDETMQEDLLKLKAAVEIVCSLHEIEKLRVQAIEMEKQGATQAEIKAVMARRKDELSQITNFARDNGFAERYATKKAKGAGTLTGIMNEMVEKEYEPSLSNYYNVKTCKAMQEAADMMFNSMWKQLNLTDSEAWGMVQKQTNKIRQLTKDNMDLTEKLRLKEIQLKEIELKQKAQDYQEQQEKEESEIVGGLVQWQ